MAWNYASSAAGVGVSGEYCAYTPEGTLTANANSVTPNPYQMSVTTSPTSGVPEPATLVQALTATGIAVIAIAPGQSHLKPPHFSNGSFQINGH